MANDSRSQISRDYFWNTASSLIGSASAVLMLLVVTRAAGIFAAGIFALSIAVGQQFQTLGAYEVRPYQATDVNHKFSFGTYYGTRIITVVLMSIAILIYAANLDKPIREIVLIALVASLRLFDAFEDVFYGEFQRLGRLDIAARANFFRVLVTTVVFMGTIAITRDLLTATVVTIVFSVLAMTLLILPPARSLFSLVPTSNWREIRNLLLACLPLFLAAFLAMYLANAPRFAIEKYLDTDFQGYYGILFMPALAINILAMFIFRPLLTRLATRWNKHDIKAFKVLIKRGLQGVLGAFVLTFVFTYFFGVAILNMLYGVSLGSFAMELMILVTGGAFNAASVILYYALATMRRQHAAFIGYVIAAAIVLVLSNLWVARSGIMGAALSYCVGMLILMVIFFFSLSRSMRQRT